MKKQRLIVILVLSIVMFTSCGTSNSETTSNTKKSDQAQEVATRISFEKNSSDDGTYIQHMKDLWIKTKPLLSEDLSKNYSDDEYKELGADINDAWVNLQIHGSLSHADEIDGITDTKLSNLDGEIIFVIGEIYGVRDADTSQAHEESREKLRSGRLDFKIKEFDDILANVE